MIKFQRRKEKKKIVIDQCDIFFEIVDFINKAKIKRFADLVKIIVENNYEEWLCFIIDHTLLITKYIESKQN